MYSVRELTDEEKVQKYNYDQSSQKNSVQTYINLILLRNGECIHHMGPINFAEKARNIKYTDEKTVHNLIARNVFVVPHMNIRTIQTFTNEEPKREIAFYQSHKPVKPSTIWNLTHIEDDYYNTWSTVQLYQNKPTKEQIANVALNMYETFEDLTNDDIISIDKLLNVEITDDIVEIDQVKIRDKTYILYPTELK